jgi:predicted RNA-binding Zn-ribbon protein involved in translation (DUF1610 family)
MSELYECGFCGELHTYDEWEIVTLRNLNRKERRKFIRFEENIKVHKNKKTEYKCPSCNTYVLRVDIKKSYLDDNDIVKV